MAWHEKPTILFKIYKKQNYCFFDESGDIKDLSSVIKKINNGSFVNRRDSNFVITGIYVGFKNLEYIYASLSNFKIKHFGVKTIIHTCDIFNKNETIKGSTSVKNSFIDELNSLVSSFRFKVVATAFNKVDYIKKYNISNISVSLSIIREIYKREFLKIEDVLKKINRKAIFVIEESSNPKIDKEILKLFVQLRTKKTLINSEKLYFTKKTAYCYPVGIELADFASRAIYSYFKNVEFIEILKKVYNSSFVSNKYIEFFDKEVKK